MGIEERAVRFPYPNYRRGQREAISWLQDVLSAGKAAGLQAPTGFGKTVVALYALMRLRSPCVLYAVRTRNELTPPFREALKLGIKVTFLYSKRHMCPLLDDPSGVATEDFWENCKELRRQALCRYYASSMEASSEDLWQAVRGSDTPYAAVRRLADEGLCPFYSLRNLVRDAEAILVTYPYLFDPYIRQASLDERVLESCAVVVDEAHSLINAGDMAERRLSRVKASMAVKEIKRYAPEATSCVARLDKLMTLMDSLLPGRGYKLVPKEHILSVLEDPSEWFDLAAEIRYEKLRSVIDPRRQARVRVHTLSVAYFAAALSLEAYEAFIVERRGTRSFVAKPIDPSVAVEEVLNRPNALVLMSGTLPPPGYYREVLRLSKEIEHLDVDEKFGPVFPRTNRMIALLTFVTSRFTRRSSAMYETYSEVVTEVVKGVGEGVVMAVYPSYEFMQSVVDLLKGALPCEVLTESEDTRISEVEERARSTRCLLLNVVAGGKLSEGVELVDRSTGRSLVGAVVIAGVPYPQPDDYQERIRRYLAERLGPEKAWEYLYLDVAAVRVRQALGRAIRSPDDKAVFVLADNRFMDPRMRRKLGVRVDRVITDVNGLRRFLGAARGFLAR